LVRRCWNQSLAACDDVRNTFHHYFIIVAPMMDDDGDHQEDFYFKPIGNCG
jgi:hypothetical protein